MIVPIKLNDPPPSTKVLRSVCVGIRIWGDKVKVRRNLVVMTLWPGSYQDREEPFNYAWNAAIEVRIVTVQHEQR